MVLKAAKKVLLRAALLILTLSLAWTVILAHPTLRDQNSEWRFDVSPPVNGTSNIIFDSVASLLQQWGNTRYRNGHNIVPATIPVGTILYHGTHHKIIPTTPEWLATDSEHAYPFCQDPRGEHGEGCFLLTVAVSRPLNLLYIDGSSASKMYGAMDIQDLIAWGRVVDTVEWIFDDWTRLELLCAWGQKYGIDGFMRMEMDFEVMLCDFSKGIEPVSFVELNFPSANRLEQTIIPSNITFLSPAFRILEAGHWHNHFPGETRAKLDLTRLISLYDPDSFPSLVDTRYGKERWEYRAKEIGEADRDTLMRKLEEMASSRPGTSGIDWQSIYRVVIHRYADRLELLQYMLQDFPVNSTTLHTVHQYVGSMLSTYILRNVEVPSPQHSTLFGWASPVFERCTTLQTQYIAKLDTLTSSERLLLRAVQDVLHEICRVTTNIWAEGVELELEDKTIPVGNILENWRRSIDELVHWLDWSVWVKCKPACGYEETCYLPTWPFFSRDSSTPAPGVDESQAHFPGHLFDGRWIPNGKADPLPEWVKPQPRCMRRLAPLEIL
ncbi:hypothetical protein BKA70DRAFT_230712 [Coprinopsis sp. MPI-PUGE-AT-0042]|nr:hypothetical protein BKA70DRAFT_230712 [Coprinopsis sp. MPI-PUGE-AT-0042]